MDVYFKYFSTTEELNSFFSGNPQHRLINVETTIDHGKYTFRAWFSSGDNNNKPEYYQVFEVDDFFDEYGMSNFYIGAKDRKDLFDHLYGIGNLSKKEVAKIIKEADWRVEAVDHMFTDTPYVPLDSNGYIE